MTNQLWIFVLFVVLTGRCYGWDNERLKKYGSLISDVHKRHRTSGVFLILSKNHRSLRDYTLIHSLTRDFSANGIRTTTIKLENLEKLAKFYGKRIVQPLIVVLLRSMCDVTEFHENTKRMNTEYAIWLMIFVGDGDSAICNYCNEPDGNILHLRIDTKMMVSCCDGRTIKEWWSVHDNKTDTAEYASWTQDEGFKLIASVAVYDRRYDVNGAGLRVAIVADSVLDSNVRDLESFYFGGVLMELKCAMNFTIKTKLSLNAFGNYNPITGNWTGVVGALAQGRIDIGVAEFTITNSRLDVIDFTMPLLLARNHLYIKQPDGSRVQWSAYFQAFHWKIWMFIIVLIFTCPILLVVISMKKRNVPVLSLFIENFLNVWGLFCQQGLFAFPAETPLRIAFFSILVSAVVVFTAYSASLTSFLTVTFDTLPFNSINGFVNDGSYKLIVIPNSSNWDLFTTSRDPNFKKMMKLMRPLKDLPKSFHDGFRQVCEKRVAFYTNSLVRRIMNDRIKCKIVSIETEQLDSLAMALAPDSQYNRIVNYHLQRFHENGILHRLKRQYLTTEFASEPNHDVVDLGGVAPILSVLLGGIVIALVVLFIERIYFFTCDKPQKSKLASALEKPRATKRPNFRDKRSKTIVTRSMTTQTKGRQSDRELFIFVN